MKRFVFRRSKPFAFAAALLTAAAVSFHPAWAAESAKAFVQGVGQDVVETLKSTPANSDAREKRLRQIFLDAFDTDTIAKFVMGRHWRRLEDDERRRYMQVFPDYVAAIYASQFADYRGQTFEVTRTRQIDDRATFVDTQIRGGGQAGPINLGIRVRKADGGYKIVDVKVEGISLLVTKRDEFGTFLSRQDASTLIDRLAQIARS